MIGRILSLLRRVVDFYLEPANATVIAAPDSAPASPPASLPLKDLTPLEEVLVMDWRRVYPDISDERLAEWVK